MTKKRLENIFLMDKLKLIFLLVCTLFVMIGCTKTEPSSSTDSIQEAQVNTPTANSSSIEFVDTQEGKPLIIDAALFDTPEAKEFLATGKNPYIGNIDAITRGQKVYQLYSCTQCHGPDAKGQVGPALVGPDFKYPKDATNKGMFETIWHGTNGGMGGKGIGIMDATDPKNGISPDEMLKVIAWIRSVSNGITGNE
jgi:cytochrome c-L